MSDLPVLVRLNGTDIDFDDILITGRDVAFFDQRGATPVRLVHDRQAFRNGTALDDEALFWVKPGAFNPSTEREHIWLYFGSGNNTETASSAQVFNSYAAAWHLDDLAANIRLPELRTGLNSRVILGDGLRTDTSLVGRGVDLVGTNAFAVIDDTTDVNQIGGPNPFGITTTQGTISVLLGPRSGNGGVLSVGQAVFFADGGGPRSLGFDQRSLHLTVASTLANGTGAADSIGFSIPTNPARPAIANPRPAPANFVASATGVINPGVFQHVTATWNASTVELYVNGVRRAQVAATTVPFTVQFLNLGTSQELANVMRGRVDELRVSTVRRDEAFARAEAKSTLGELIVVGAVEARP